MMRGNTEGRASRDSLPAELEQRIAELETGGQCGEDFDSASLIWLLLLGIVLPAALLIAGWWG
jgi:hypothetical protein